MAGAVLLDLRSGLSIEALISSVVRSREAFSWTGVSKPFSEDFVSLGTSSSSKML